MEVILLERVEKLGQIGDVVNVKPGFARNYLLPRKLAIKADPGAMKALEGKKKVLELKGEHAAGEARQMAEKIDNLTVTVAGKAGSGTKLYGSITNQEIADALLAQHQVSVDKRNIHITEPIKSIGSFAVPIKLHHEVSATIHVEVVGKEE